MVYTHRDDRKHSWTTENTNTEKVKAVAYQVIQDDFQQNRDS